MKSFIDNYLYFIYSSRFWQVVIASLLFTAVYSGWLPSENADIIAQLVASVLGISVSIRTVDRFGEQLSK